MAATRLSDAQKQEIVGRYRQGETSTALAAAYGCSANTVSRVLKAALDPDDYERLKQQRGRRASGSSAAGVEPAAGAEEAVAAKLAVAAEQPVAAEQAVAADQLELSDGPAAPEPPAPESAAAPQREATTASTTPASRTAAGAAPDGSGADGDSSDDGPGVLAIDDADDFGDDDSDDGADDDADAEEEDSAEGAAADAAERELVQCQALSEVELPGSAYMLVDKVVELQPTALRDCSDLGPLPEEEADRQALQVYLNPRQAKRHCGRSQRVIKVPDLRVFQRTAPYLLAKGISRVVIEGSLYSLPGS